MDMDHSPRVLDKLLEQCVEVSVERKSEILCEWAGKRMCHGLPLESCASCGIRDPDRDYHVVRLKELPSVFRLDKDACARPGTECRSGSNPGARGRRWENHFHRHAYRYKHAHRHA